MKRTALAAWFGVWVVALGLGCDSADPGDPVAGTIALAADEGINFFSGKLQKPGNFANSDLYTSRNADGLKLATGGPDATKSRPVNWFKTGGGVPRTFASLAEVPFDRPDEAMTEPLIHAKAGNGFLVKRADGGYTRGWIATAEGTTVTIEFVPDPDDATP